MVGDYNPKAYDRLDLDFNFAGFPSCFFDGGYAAYVGAPSPITYYSDRIDSAGHRPAADIDMIVGMRVGSGANTYDVRVRVVNGGTANTHPAVPTITPADEVVSPGESAICMALGTDPDGDDLSYRIDWGDGTVSDWGSFAGSGVVDSAAYAFTDIGYYDIRVQSRDWFGAESDWSDPVSLRVGCCIGLAGNVNGDSGNNVDISDLTRLVNHLFVDFLVLPCPASANTNGDSGCSVDISDLTKLVNHLFVTFEPLAACQLECE